MEYSVDVDTGNILAMEKLKRKVEYRVNADKEKLSHFILHKLHVALIDV